MISKFASVSSLLKAGTIAGAAVAVTLTGMPALQKAFAEPVKIQAQAVPGFADVVAAVSPAVVSVRVQSRANPVNDDTAFNFGGPENYDQLPDDHPLKRFFREFGGPDQFGDRQFGDRQPGQRRSERWPDHRNEKPRLRPTSQGSGFFITEDGYLVTNNHVIDGGTAFTVVMNDGTELDAKLVGKDPRTDLAVLKVDDKRKFTYVSFADDKKVRVGDWVVAVGNPFGLGGTVTAGIVSALGRDIGAGPYDDFLQVDAAVNRGNSGGPTFDLSGQVVGINTAIFSPSGGNVGIAFAIPASVAKDVVGQLMKGGEIARGWLGIKIEPVTQDVAEAIGLSEAAGALVNGQQNADSPGYKAGLRDGDVVTAVDGDPIKGPKELARKIGSLAPDKTVDLSVWRDGKSISVKVTLGKMQDDTRVASADPNRQGGTNGGDDEQAPIEQSLDKLGLRVAPADDGNGVQIVDVDPQSDAADKGVKAGEKITSVNNQDVKTAADIQKVIEDAKKDGRKKALFQIEDQNGNRFVALGLG